ncbi:MAG: zeta toxin family protein [Lactobacillaceae bacterium]|nr:zeta toxin family protein [Lactobacillaceae bacterium]
MTAEKNIDEKTLEYAKAHKREFVEQVIGHRIPEEDKLAIFMAGTPGAGKTEVAVSISEMLGDNLSIIDADVFRESFPGYNGANSSDFQHGASWLVDHTFTYLIKKNYSFILDGTFSHGRTMQNIELLIPAIYTKEQLEELLDD